MFPDPPALLAEGLGPGDHFPPPPEPPLAPIFPKGCEGPKGAPFAPPADVIVLKIELDPEAPLAEQGPVAPVPPAPTVIGKLVAVIVIVGGDGVVAAKEL